MNKQEILDQIKINAYTDEMSKIAYDKGKPHKKDEYSFSDKLVGTVAGGATYYKGLSGSEKMMQSGMSKRKGKLGLALNMLAPAAGLGVGLGAAHVSSRL